MSLEILHATELLVAWDILDRPAILPKGAVLLDYRIGPGDEGHPRANPNLASFHVEGILYYSSISEVQEKTKQAWLW